MPTLTLDPIEQQARFLGALETAIARSVERALAGAGTPDDLRLSAYARTTDWEALTVTLRGPVAPEYWEVSRLTLHGVTATNPSTAQSPIAGLFLVPEGAVIESLADGQSLVGWNIESRGIPLPAGVVNNYTTVAAATVSYAYVISLTQSTPIIIRPGETLRGMVSVNPGTAQPGPGAGSWGILTAMGVRRMRR